MGESNPELRTAAGEPLPADRGLRRDRLGRYVLRFTPCLPGASTLAPRVSVSLCTSDLGEARRCRDAVIVALSRSGVELRGVRVELPSSPAGAEHGEVIPSPST